MESRSKSNTANSETTETTEKRLLLISIISHRELLTCIMNR